MKLALVFSGGGSRGAYQVGVWKALNELGIKANIAVGTSTGSITAALYCVNNLDAAIKTFESISVRNIFNRDKLGIKKEPVNLKKLIIKNINYNDLVNSGIKYGLVVTSSPRMKKVEITLDQMDENNYFDYIIASCTIPIIFKKTKIGKKKFIDGGARDAVPVNLAEKLGADKIIIVNTSLVGRKYVPKNGNHVMIKPSKKIASPIKFDEKESKKMLELGYKDAMNTLKDIVGDYLE